MAMIRLRENDRSLPMVDTIMRDAMYIALEARDAAMITCDSLLVTAPGHRARIGHDTTRVVMDR